MKFFYLLVFRIIESCLFDDLIVKKTNVGLVLCRHDLFLRLDFMERLMQVFYLFVVHVLSGLDSIHQLLDPGLSLFQSVDVVSLYSLKLFMLGLQYFVFFLDKFLELFSLNSQRLNDIFLPIL
jgi:hypothetical protein